MSAVPCACVLTCTHTEVCGELSQMFVNYNNDCCPTILKPIMNVMKRHKKTRDIQSRHRVISVVSRWGKIEDKIFIGRKIYVQRKQPKTATFITR